MSNLKGCLGNQFDEFIKDFYEAQHSSVKIIFEHRWKNLIQKYDNNKVVNYLQRTLYSTKETWARAFILTFFAAGMSLTSRVESYNAKIKHLICNFNITILKLAEVLSTCVSEEDKRTEYSLFHASVPKIALYLIADTILPNVCKLLKSYLTEEIRKIQEDQIVQALHYHANCVTKNEMQTFNLGHQTEQLNEQPDEQSDEQSDVEESCSISDKENIDFKDLVNPVNKNQKEDQKGLIENGKQMNH
ncbi:25115_t:CDS:2 [Gigaspora rosea]|nr:25115_t:CDS:2 [Gigaspora rosea]